MKITCTSCGESVVRETQDDAEAATCPSCGAPLAAARQPGVGEKTRRIRRSDLSGAETLFQPGIMVSSILGESQSGTGTAKPAAGVSQPAAETQLLGSAAETRLLSSVTASAPRVGVEGYFLVLGAAPGRERLPLVAARTVIGRKGADLPLEDSAVSGRHCQIEVMGAEFFVRDLDSRNGTFLNEHKIRYSQLLPGDELRVGKTTLVFRTSNDGISDRE